MLLAERVREELEKTIFHPPGKLGPSGTPLGISVNCSIGIATFPDAGSNWDEMFKAADESLYVSKRSGRNRSTAWSASMNKAGTKVQPAA
jgi:GGDEF domain-containing protein